ncbi:MAG: hypothetical protein U5R30_21955 [Deltaproteobacteria bacterium]|nr:hypothetical protein [Deltaproteobacteria bacterium]
MAVRPGREIPVMTLRLEKGNAKILGSYFFFQCGLAQHQLVRTRPTACGMVFSPNNAPHGAPARACDLRDWSLGPVRSHDAWQS